MTKTPWTLAAVAGLALVGLATPAQAAAIIGGPCQGLYSPDPIVQNLLNECRNGFNNLDEEALALVSYALDQMPEPCSDSENVVPIVVDCANYVIAFVINNLPPVVPDLGAVLAWAQAYQNAVVAWEASVAGQVNTYETAVGNWALTLPGYGTAASAWAGGAVTVVQGDANAQSAYVVCRLISPVPCGPQPPIVQPATPPSPGSPPIPSVPPSPPVPPLPPPH